MASKISISVIVPVYNEAHRLADCLTALQSQLGSGDEVLVIDNNSRDGSGELAASLGFKVIKEPRQGLTHARNTGFNAATKQILARIDADTVVLPGWIERLRADFADPELDGVSGPAVIRDAIPSLWPMLFWSRGYLKMIARYFGHPVLWGANMAIRHEAWLKVRDQTTNDDSLVHEDQDLSALLHRAGCRLWVDDQLRVSIHGLSFASPNKLFEYFKRAGQTARRHRP